MSIFPESSDLTPEQAAAARLAGIDHAGNSAIKTFANAVAQGLANVWLPTDTTPALMLAAMGDKAVARFGQSHDAVAYLWADDERRDEFLAACEAHGVTVNVVNQLPVFPCRLPFTENEDGTITLD